MNTAQKLLAIALLLCTSATAWAQSGNTASATGTASGTVVTPIGVTKNADLSFGSAVAQASGTVTVPALSSIGHGAMTYSGAGNTCTDPGATNFGTPTAASFTVTGQATYTFGWTASVGSADQGSFALSSTSGSGTVGATILLGATCTMASSPTNGLHSATITFNAQYD